MRPMLWHARVIGWANVLASPQGRLQPSFGYADAKPSRSTAFGAGLDEELHRMTRFLAGR